MRRCTDSAGTDSLQPRNFAKQRQFYYVSNDRPFSNLFYILLFRLEIEDIGSGFANKHENKESQKMKTAPKPALEITSTKMNDDYDDELRKLIIPKKIVRSKLSQAVSNIKNLCPKKLPNKIKK